MTSPFGNYVGNDFNTFDSAGDTSYGCEGGILILYPSSERVDLDDLEEYKSDRDNYDEEDYYGEEETYYDYDVDNDCYD